MNEPKKQTRTSEFYKDFYDKNRIALLQYRSLRFYFNEMVDDCLGANYCNTAMDVYDSDRICCEEITRKLNDTILQRILNTGR